MTFFISLFILDMQFLWKYIDDLVGKGLEWNLIAELLFYASATFVPLALPLAILLSSIMTFGNLGEHYELVAMKAAGIPLKKLMRPLVILTILISFGAFFFSNHLLPRANLKFQSLYYDIRHKKLAFNIKEGIFYNDMDGYTIRIGKKDKDDIKIYDVMIYNHTDRLGNIDVTTAKSGKMETTSDGRFLIFTLYDGYSYKDVVNVSGYREKRPLERNKFSEQQKKFDLSNFEMNRTNEDLFKDHYMMLNISQLKYTIDSLNTTLAKRRQDFNQENSNYINYNRTDSTILPEIDTFMLIDQKPFLVVKKDTFRNLSLDVIKTYSNKKNIKIYTEAKGNAKMALNKVANTIKDIKRRERKINKHHAVWHEKFTLSIACIILFFIGAPLGAIIRKGGLGMPVVISVIFFIFFHILSITGKKYVIAGALDPIIGMWFASAILLPIGIFLTYKSTRDAPLLDADSWIKKIKSILDLFINFGKKSP